MLSRFFIDRPIFAWVVAIVIMLAGALAIRSLPIARAALTEAEWRAVERAFIATADPLIESQSRRQRPD